MEAGTWVVVGDEGRSGGQVGRKFECGGGKVLRNKW